MPNISLRSSGMRRKQIFFRFLTTSSPRLEGKSPGDEVGFLSDAAVLTFPFRFLSSPLFSLFLPHFFLCFPGHLVGFILVGNVSRKTFRILGLNERKGRCVAEQDFHGNFRVTVTLACTQTLFYFSFRSLGKHRRARKRGGHASESESERGARERKITSPTPTPCAGGQ